VTEADILELIQLDTQWNLTLLQWWVSITIGLVAAGHFVGRKLNRGMAAVLLALYIGYTLSVAGSVVISSRFSATYVAALIELRDTGTHLSPSGTAMIESDVSAMGAVSGIALLVCVIGAFIATVVYVGHAAFSKERRRT
jgi:hypothetical protein